MSLSRLFFRAQKLACIFREFHLDFAQTNASLEDSPDLDDDGESLRPPSLLRTPVLGGDWIDKLPLMWHGLWRHCSDCSPFSLAVLQQLVDWLQNERLSGDVSCSVSWLELTAVLEGTDFVHPILCAQGSRTVWSDPCSAEAHQHQPMTVAARVRFLKGIFRGLDTCYDLD